jgi:selenocysteine lyase/cysteine desulfurase
MQGDFPSDILPWLGLEARGVHVRLIEPRQRVVQADELRAQLTPATRLFCTTWVHSFSGFAVDLQALGAVCREHGVVFLANCSQAIGTRPLDLSRTPVDAITCVGFKWLCGPYGTGFAWIRPALRETLEYNQAYWLAMQTSEDLGGEDRAVALRTDLGARRYDVFGTANFFNYKPWTAAVEYLLDRGIDAVAAHNDRLVSRFIDGLDRDKYRLLSPAEGAMRSTLIFVSHRHRDRNKRIHETLLREGIHVAYRAGSLRIAPHLHNDAACIDRALSLLNRA